MSSTPSLPSLGDGVSQLESVIRSGGRRVEQQFPYFRDSLLDAWNSYLIAHARLKCWKHSLRHTQHAELYPFEIIQVDPDEIEYLLHPDGYPVQVYSECTFPKEKFKYAGTVRDGTWDTNGARFEDTDLYRAFRAHFDNGVDWTETTFFTNVVDLIEDGTVLWGCTNRAEFEQRCDHLDELYESIRTHGLVSQRELASSDVNDPIGNDDLPWAIRVVYHELTVCIGREGELLFFDGRNRLAIAKLLDLDTIPVWVMIRHKRWQDFRERVAKNDVNEHSMQADIENHPDLQRISKI